MMNAPIPPEFEAFAREQVAAGRYSSEAEVVADVLKHYLADRKALLALLDPAIEQLDRGEGHPFDAEDTKRRGRERRQRGHMPKIIVSPLAQADIDEIWDYIARAASRTPTASSTVSSDGLASWPTIPDWGSRERIFDLACGASPTRAI